MIEKIRIMKIREYCVNNEKSRALIAFKDSNDNNIDSLLNDLIHKDDATIAAIGHSIIVRFVSGSILHCVDCKHAMDNILSSEYDRITLYKPFNFTDVELNLIQNRLIDRGNKEHLILDEDDISMLGKTVLASEFENLESNKISIIDRLTILFTGKSKNENMLYGALIRSDGALNECETLIKSKTAAHFETHQNLLHERQMRSELQDDFDNVNRVNGENSVAIVEIQKHRNELEALYNEAGERVNTIGHAMYEKDHEINKLGQELQDSMKEKATEIIGLQADVNKARSDRNDIQYQCDDLDLEVTSLKKQAAQSKRRATIAEKKANELQLVIVDVEDADIVDISKKVHELNSQLEASSHVVAQKDKAMNRLTAQLKEAKADTEGYKSAMEEAFFDKSDTNLIDESGENNERKTEAEKQKEPTTF